MITANVSAEIVHLRNFPINCAYDAEYLRDNAVELLEQLSDLLISISECDEVEEVTALLEGVAL
jgi:hypothetical protein